MKIVVLDGHVLNPGDVSWDGLRALGNLTVYERCSQTCAQQAIERIGDAEIVITNKTPITRTVIDACPGMKFVAVMATGYNVVDTEYAAQKGIRVSNVPDYGTDSVAQFAIGLLLELCHRIGHHDNAVHQRRWELGSEWCFWDCPQIELAGKTMGIVGFGRIGHRVGQIARALNMRVIVNSRHENSEFVKEGFEYVDKDTLYRESDVIMLHCPLFPGTENLICAESISKMKDGVILVNNSRGGLVNEKDLAAALNSKKIYGAAVDVVSEEPIKGDNPLLKAKNCIITPHMSWGAQAARQRIVDATVENVRAYQAGNCINVVNL